MHAKWISQILAFVAALAVDIPKGFQVAVWCFFWAFMADNVTGVWAAGSNRQLRSAVSREKMRLKLFAYFGIMAGFFIMGYAVGQGWSPCWPLITAGVAWITANEVQSILENVVKLQISGGVNLGLLAPALKMLAGWFGISDQPRLGMTVAATATAIPSDPSQPVIQTTRVERMDGN